MLEAISLNDILRNTGHRLPEVLRLSRKEPVVELGYMTAFDFRSGAKYRTVTFEETIHSRLIGILFCLPDSPLGKSEVVPHLNYFHQRSAEAVDFFCVGYGAYWPPGTYPDQRIVTRIEDTEWLFSEKAFSSMTAEIEGETSWSETGESSLILLVAHRRPDGTVYLDYKSAIVFNLEQMMADKTITSVRAFFNMIFAYAKGKGRSTLALSDAEGMRLARGALKEAMLGLLPAVLSGKAAAATHYAVRDISRR